MSIAIRTNPKNFSLSGFIKIIRFPNLMIIFLAQYMTSIFLLGNIHQWDVFLLDWKLFLLSVSTATVAAAGYIINDYYDVKIDFINKPERVVVGKILKRRVVMVYHTILNLTGILIGTFISFKIGFLHFLSAFLLWLYSNYLKRQPLSGNLVIALLTALSIIVVDILYKANEPAVYYYALFAFLVTLIREIIKDIEDVKGDANFDCKTLPIIWGVRKTKFFIYFIIGFFTLVILLSSNLLNNHVLGFYFLGMSGPVFYFIVKLIKADTIKDFTFLSNYCKLLMLIGIFSMVFI
jgi:4-hydroxybenzoate polyprenyltransferase